MEDIRNIVALGGGGFTEAEHATLLDEYILRLSPAARPEICFVATASSDDQDYIRRFYASFKRMKCRPTHLDLDRFDAEGLRSFLLEQDVIYVGGGATAHMLGVWRKSGLDVVLREAWERGVVLAGVSAGSICWFEEGVTDSLAADLAVLRCLGFLPGSNCVHYDSESLRRPFYREAVQAGRIRGGWAADDDVALHFRGAELCRAVSTRAGAKAYRLEQGEDAAVETAIVTEVLR